MAFVLEQKVYEEDDEDEDEEDEEDRQRARVLLLGGALRRKKNGLWGFSLKSNKNCINGFTF
jgi:hypothetical protein